MAFGPVNVPGVSGAELEAVRAQAMQAAQTSSAAQQAAEAADNTARAALEAANSAAGAADAAQGTADAALQAANDANSAAAAAGNAADAAQQTADAAKQTADAAAQAAQNAQSSASSALEAVKKLTSTINAVPSQAGIPTYTGGVIQPNWNNFDPEQLTMTGQMSGTDAGDYVVTCTPREGLQWFDGSTEGKQVTWKIARATVEPPKQSGTLTYTGGTLTPTWSGMDNTKMTMTGTTSGTDAGDYSASVTPTKNYQWGDGSITAKTVKWTIAKAAGSSSINKSTMSLSSVGSTDTITVTRSGDGAVTASSDNASIASVSVDGTTVTVTAKGDGSAKITIKVAAGKNHTAPADKTCTVTVTLPKIYGAQWDGTSTTKWTRTDAAALFTDPTPAVNNGSGSSPFDNLQPWAGMVKSERTGGTMVAIPKFWYKWTKSGNTLKLQIADKATAGFNVSPAHADRGDGKGERDVVYVARYHCGSSAYKSVTGQAQKVSITRDAARTAIKGLGTGIWQWDMAMRVTIQMLYLVEFADWNSQAKIGYGCSASGSKANNGQTDSMKYHTGTTAANRTTYGYTQYRNIEGLWDNVYDWLDGCYYNSNGLNIIKNPANFSDTANGTLVGKPSSGYPSAMAVGTASGLEWVIYPTAASGSDSTYVPDNWGFSASHPCLYVGGNYSQSQGHGLFYVSYNAASLSNASIGCRLQELP